MKRHVVAVVRTGLLAALAGAVLGGCSVINTVGEGLSSTVEGITDVTSSTSSDERSATFVENRFAAIRSEAARGQGENLDSLAALLGEPDRAGFARFMQQHYAELFVGLTQPRELLDRIDRYRGTREGAPKGA